MVQDEQSCGWSKGEWHGEHSSLVNWESCPYFLGMMGKQVRREQKEMPAVVRLLSVKMEMKSNQKVMSRLLFFAGLFSILLTFTYTNRLSTSTCVESKLP